MDNFSCENCGSNHIIEENGIATCQACGTKYPNLKLKNIGLDEELKEKEIKRLIEVNNKTVKSEGELEPRIGILTDDEILKYSPKSNVAKKIIAKRSGKFTDKLKVYGYLIGFYIFMMLFLGIPALLIWNVIQFGTLSFFIISILILILPLIILKYYKIE